jgi:hypothetical protein
MSEEAKPLFRGLTADDEDLETTQIESLCMNCGENVSFIMCLLFFLWSFITYCIFAMILLAYHPNNLNYLILLSLK